MNKEIKEILDNLDFEVNYMHNWVEPLGLDKNTWKQLLDYITNLQKEKDTSDDYARHLHNENKKLQEENEDLREDNYAYHQLMKIQNKREYRSKFLKEFQEEFGTNVFPDYDEIYKRYDKLKKENERLNNIIDELEKELKKDMEVYICGKSNGKTFKFVEKIVKAYYLNKLKELKG